MLERLLKLKKDAVEEIKHRTGIDVSTVPIVVCDGSDSPYDGTYCEGTIYLYGESGINSFTLIHEYMHYLVDQKFCCRDDDYVMMIAEELMAEAAAKALSNFENPFEEGVLVSFIASSMLWFFEVIDDYASNFGTEAIILVKIFKETGFDFWSETISSLLKVIKK